MKTLHRYILDAGDRLCTMDHILGWVAGMNGDPNVNIRADWPAAPDEAGNYVVTITARDLS